MRYVLVFLFLCLFPLKGYATVLLANCDDEPHDVIVRNAGGERVVHLTKFGGEIEEFGPIGFISFQVKDAAQKEPAVRPLSPYEEFCIWKGKIRVQRLNTGGNGGGGGISLR